MPAPTDPAPLLPDRTNHDRPAPSQPAMDRPAVLAALRARIARAERRGAESGLDNALVARGASDGTIPLCGTIDAALPGGGLLRAALHEVQWADPGAGFGFCALLLARAAGTVLWIAAEPDAWPPGLSRFGLAPADLVLVRAPRRTDALWAMEEALRCPAVAGVLLAGDAAPDLTASRRLQLAAEAGGGIGLLLRPADEADAAGSQPAAASVATTRWRVESLAGGGQHDLGDPRWRLELLRARGGRPQNWDVVWRGAQERLETDEDHVTEEALPVLRREARQGMRHGARR